MDDASPGSVLEWLSSADYMVISTTLLHTVERATGMNNVQIPVDI